MALPSVQDKLEQEQDSRLPGAEIRICDLDESAEGRWDEFVLRQDTGTFFHLTGWKRVIEKTFGYKPCYCYAERDGTITAVAPLFLVKNWVVGKCLVSTPFAVYGGVCASDKESEESLLAHLEQFAREANVGYLELRNKTGPLRNGCHANTLYSTFSKELTGDVEANFKRLPNDTRYMIRRATKAGLTSRRGLDQMETFYDLVARNLHHHGTPMFPKSLFTNLVDEFSRQVDLLVICQGEEPVSAVMSFFFKDTVLPYYAGLGLRANKLGANNFMYWELMKYAAESGYRRFDFGRSKKDTGAYKFKLQWNMEVQHLEYQVYLVTRKIAPNFSPVNPKFERATKIWQKLPLWGANLVGPHVVKWFP